MSKAIAAALIAIMSFYGSLLTEYRESRPELLSGRMSVDLMVRAGMEPDPWQLKLLNDRPKRLLMNITRQGGKSSLAAGLAVDTAVEEPGSLTLLVSRAQRQAGELLRKVRDLFYAAATPPHFRYESALQLELDNRSRVIALPGVEATVRSYSGARLIVFDEMARILDDLYKAMRPMIAVSGGMMVGASTPFGKRGCFYEAWETEEEWTKVAVNALEIPRISPEFLEEERKRLGEKWFLQEYMCSFEDMEGAAFTAEEIAAIFDQEAADAMDMYS